MIFHQFLMCYALKCVIKCNKPVKSVISQNDKVLCQIIHFSGDISEKIRYKIIHFHQEGESQRKTSEKQEFPKLKLSTKEREKWDSQQMQKMVLYRTMNTHLFKCVDDQSCQYQSLKLSSLREEKMKLHSCVRSEKTTLHYGSERMCCCQEAVSEKRK